MQIPILNGIYTNEQSDFRTSYPRNMVPVPKQNGISTGYLRPADGIVLDGTGPGVDRGGIEWNGTCYRVMGTKLVRINSDGSSDVLGDVDGSGQVTLDQRRVCNRIAARLHHRLHHRTFHRSIAPVDDHVCIVV